MTEILPMKLTCPGGGTEFLACRCGWVYFTASRSGPEGILQANGKGQVKNADLANDSINAAVDPEIAADDDYLERASTATCPKCDHKVRFGMLIADARTGTFTQRN